MTSKEYLERIGTLERKIKSMKNRVKEYNRLSYAVPGQDFTRERVQSTPSNKTPYEKWVTLKIDMEKKIKDATDELNQLKAEAIVKIENLYNEDYKTVLVLRYFQFKGWDDIASNLCVVRRTAMRYHEKALAMITV